MKLYEIFDSKAISMYWSDVNAHMKDEYIGVQFFPNSKQTGLKLDWIKGRNNLPIALQPSAFDTKASLRDRIGVSKISTEMPFFRESMRIGEKDRQDIETLLASNEQFAQPLILRIFDDVRNLVDGALVQAERMRMSLLYSGGIDITTVDSNNRAVAYQYNYDTSGTWATSNKVELLTNSKWTTAQKATSNPIEDILTAVEKMKEERGITPTRILMNTVTLKGMLASESIVKAMNPLGAIAMQPTRKELIKFMEEQTDLTFIIYDKMFKDEKGKDQKFFPDGYATLLPNYTLGNTWFGTTPEEFDLLNKVDDKTISVSIVNVGVAITTIKEPHPVNVQTIVSEIVLPSFERMDDIYIIKAF